MKATNNTNQTTQSLKEHLSLLFVAIVMLFAFYKILDLADPAQDYYNDIEKQREYRLKVEADKYY